jgi:hypothetical protein
MFKASLWRRRRRRRRRCCHRRRRRRRRCRHRRRRRRRRCRHCRRRRRINFRRFEGASLFSSFCACHYCTMSHYRCHDILSSCHFVHCQFNILSSCHFVNLDWLTKCQVDELSSL